MTQYRTHYIGTNKEGKHIDREMTLASSNGMIPILVTTLKHLELSGIKLNEITVKEVQ